MICKKCGKEFKKNCCPFCGTRSGIADSYETSEMRSESKCKRKTQKKIKSKIIIASITTVSLIITIGVLLCLHKFIFFNNTIDDSENTDISMVEKITEEDARKVENLIKEISSLEGTGKGQQEIKAYLEDFEWIKNVSETEDGGLTCVTEFGVTGVWTPKVENTIGNIIQATQTHVTYAEPIAPRHSYYIERIAVLCPFASEDPSFNLDGYSFLGEVMEEYTDCEVSFFKDEEVSLELLKNLDQFDMVWFYSHGSLSNVFNSAWDIVGSDPYTMTGEFVDSPSAYALLSSDFFYGRTIVGLSDGRIGIGGNFYKHYYSENQLDGMFFHFASCNSMKNDKLADGLLSRGAAWVEGWDNSVNFNNDYTQFSSVLKNLLEGNDVNQAIKNAEVSVKDKYDFYQKDCNLKGKGDNNYKLVIIKYEWDFSQSLEETHNLISEIHGDTEIIDLSEGTVQKAAFFDGDGDYIECGTDINITENFTFNALICCSDVDKHYSNFFAKYEYNREGSYAFSVNQGRINCWITQIGNDYVELESNTILKNNEWYFVSFVKEGTTIRLYINGILENNMEINAVKQTNDVVTIGRQALMFYSEDQLQYTGYIAKISIFEEALDSQTLSDLSRKAMQ